MLFISNLIVKWAAAFATRLVGMLRQIFLWISGGWLKKISPIPLSCGPLCEHADAGDCDPCLGVGDRLLPILGQSATAIEPCEGVQSTIQRRGKTVTLSALSERLTIFIAY